MNYTYILECRDGTLYTGWTTDVEKRLLAHNGGNGAKYTKSRRPVKLAYYEVYETKEEAMRREWAIKRMSRQAKLVLIQGFYTRIERGAGRAAPIGRTHTSR